MFGDLFEDSDTGQSKGNSPSVKSSGSSVQCPSAVRSKCGLPGIDNRGATCYMNALLQTLFLTPEFRESLFALGPSELGNLADKDKPGAKVRVIPIQLQRLFSQLLLLDQHSVSTEELTDSFGWKNNEEFQQHDVQELNRILFSAVEDSLVGTSGQNLISELYHGIIVNKITCEVCGRVSEREEDFLDLTLAVAYYSGLEDTLKTCYVDVEKMDGRNQYHCSSCDRLVDAVKSAKLRSLPPILTISLLRFSFDYQRCERYKETGKYTFPEEIDMSNYTEKMQPSEETVYELFSVLIHSGSTHGGHYHAYIKDIDRLGTWTQPEKEIVLFPSKQAFSKGKVDVIELNSPQELLATLLKKHGGLSCTMAVDKLCQALSEETGVSWNKRFKKKFGSVTKFVKYNNDLFIFDAGTNSVCLRHSTLNSQVNTTIQMLSQSDKAISKSDPCLVRSSFKDTVTPTASPTYHLDTCIDAGREGVKCGDTHGETSSVREVEDSTDGDLGSQLDRHSSPTSGVHSKNHSDGSHLLEQEREIQDGDSSVNYSKAESLQESAAVSEAGRGDAIMPQRGNSFVKSDEVVGHKPLISQACVSGDFNPNLNSTDGSDSIMPRDQNSPKIPEHDLPKSTCHCHNCESSTQDTVHWFDFNDSRVSSIDETSDLPRQFSGRESAYMLFYRRRSMMRTQSEESDSSYGMPRWLIDEVKEANKQLHIQRENYDTATNRIDLTFLLSDHYEYRGSALHRKPNIDIEPKILSLDRRRSVADLKTEIVKTLGSCVLNGLTAQRLCLHTAMELPAGLHLYNCISENDSAILQDIGLKNGLTLFLWDGKRIDGMTVKTGEACEPVLVHLTYAVTRDNRETTETSRGFAKDLTIGEMRAMLSVETDIPLELLRFSRMVSDTSVVIRDEDDGKTVEEIKLQNGDRIIAEYKRKGKAASLAANEALRHSRLVCVNIENHCALTPEGSDWPVTQVEIDKDATVLELKTSVICQLKEKNSWATSTASRLRLSDSSCGLLPPLHESLKMIDVGIKSGTEVIIEPGDPPKENQLSISFAVCQDQAQLNHQETFIDKNSTVQQTTELLMGLAGVTGDQWHLRKTNWMGEPAECLQDLDAKLCQQGVPNGSLVLLEEGRLPPKGFIRLPIWLYPSPDRGMTSSPIAQCEMLQWINTHIMNLISQGSSSIDAGASPSSSHHALLGDVELSQDATIMDLKTQIQTLPAMSEVVLPSAGFMRLRLVEQGMLGRIFRDSNQTLRRSKVTSASRIAVQILPEEENLSLNTIVLNICQRIPGTRTYTGKEELAWDTTKSASPSHLRQVIANRLLIVPEQTILAKHLSQKYEWLVIQDQTVENKSGKGSGRRKGGGGGGRPKVNLKQQPYSLKDGDTIGVKDLRFDAVNPDDFMTEEDDVGKKRLDKEAEEKRKKRQELKENNEAWNTGSRRPKRTEVGLTIRVEDFR